MRYGWLPDLPDQRDFRFISFRGMTKTLPRKVDLTPFCPPVVDQGQLGSCTANAIAAAHEFEQMKQDVRSAFLPSRLFIYYNERVLERTVNEDAGAMIRDGMKSVANQGVCPEAEWPYNVARFAAKPSPVCYKDALNHQVVSYQRVTQDLAQMRACLAAGYPFVFGFTVYESFESAAVAKTGKVPMPAQGESALGGHAVLSVGYDDASKRFIVRNSYGEGWGMKGYFTLPFQYLVSSDLASDLWTVRLVE